MDNPCPSTVLLVSGDRDFSYCLSVLQNRGYTVALVAPTSTHASLREQADTVFAWTELFPAAVPTPPKTSEAEPVERPSEGGPAAEPPSQWITWASIGIQCDPLPTSPISESAYLPEEDCLADDDAESLGSPADYGGGPPSTASEDFMHPLMQQPDEWKHSQTSSPPPLAQEMQPASSQLGPEDPPDCAPAPTPPPPRAFVPPAFADLVSVLQEAQLQYPKPTRHSVAVALRKRNPLVYQLAGIR